MSLTHPAISRHLLAYSQPLSLDLLGMYYMMLHYGVAHLLAPYNFKMHMYPDDIQTYSNSSPTNVLQITH